MDGKYHVELSWYRYILSMSSSLKENHSLIPNFQYVRTEDNPADLLTKGISFKEFQKELVFLD